MRSKYQSQVASLTAQVEKMSLDVSKAKEMDSAGETSTFPGPEIETLKEKLSDYTESYTKLKTKHKEMKEKYEE